eukprot:gene19462-38820_t
MPSSSQMAASDPDLAAAVRRARKLLHRRAMVAAAASVVPVPGLDWAVDAALLSRLIPQINTEFGLSAGICTTSLKYASDFKRNAEAGMVMVTLPPAGVANPVPLGARKARSYARR